MKENCFRVFKTKGIATLIPNKLNDPFDSFTPEICKIAALELQAYINKNKHNWKHNFGLEKDKKGVVKGKMFGVLVVENSAKEVGYLSTFSGKIEDSPHPTLFVPSLFDISTNDFFITKGMTELTQIGNKIKELEIANKIDNHFEIEQLKEIRKLKSYQLQQELFDHYQFLNKAGNIKSLCAIFKDYNNKKPAAGSGECAAPKLFQYAFEHNLKPLAIAEFWWGQPTKNRIHGEFYPACNDKCKPILSYMLSN